VTLGLTYEELQDEIVRQMAALDEAQEEGEHLGPYGDLLRLAAQIAFQRAADLIVANNRRLAEQLAALGLLDAPDGQSPTARQSGKLTDPR
jgi:hypothetical protein